MILKAVGVVLGLVLTVAIATAMLPTIFGLTHEQRVEPATATKTCSTGSGQNTCTVVLDEEHMHSDTTHLTVKETSPGSGTRSASLASDRKTITVSGLSPNTNYTFQIDYERQNPKISGGLADMLNIFPILLLLVLLVAGVVGGVIALTRG